MDTLFVLRQGIKVLRENFTGGQIMEVIQPSWPAGCEKVCLFESTSSRWNNMGRPGH